MHNDPVDSPEHYQFGQLEAWDIIELAVADIRDPVTAYHVASALKYLLRAARKGGDTDIAKASAHLKRETARHVTTVPTTHPMAAEALRDQDETTPGCAPIGVTERRHKHDICETPIEAKVCDSILIRGAKR